MKKFIKNIKKYKSYMMYSAKATLKSEVAGSRLNWLWWILDPFFFMLVYTFVALVVYGKSEPYFPLFVFIGLNLWNYFSKTVTKSVKAVKSCKGMISKVYLPKYILVLTTMLVNLFKMLVAFSLVVVMVPMYHVPITWRLIEIVPLFLVLSIFTFGCSCILLNFGVYDPDKSNNGYLDILHMIETIRQRFFKNPILNHRYECESKMEWALQDEESYPYNFGSLSMNFLTAPIEREDEWA